MLIARIEKEVEDDHKVALGCNLKQLICLVGIVAVCGVFYLASRSLALSFFCSAPVAVGLAYFGWYTRNGMQPEDILLKKLQAKYFKNDARRYRTKNSYFALYNEALTRQGGIAGKGKAGYAERKRPMRERKSRAQGKGRD